MRRQTVRRMKYRHFVPYVPSDHWLKAFCVSQESGLPDDMLYELFPPIDGYKPKNPKKRIYNISLASMHNDWRKVVLKNDNYICQNCGATDSLEAHHIHPQSFNPHLRYIPENGVTLCNVCHDGAHTYGSKYFKPSLDPDDFNLLTKNVSLINKIVLQDDFWEYYTGIRMRARLYYYDLQNQIPDYEGRDVKAEKADFRFLKNLE